MTLRHKQLFKSLHRRINLANKTTISDFPNIFYVFLFAITTCIKIFVFSEVEENVADELVELKCFYFVLVQVDKSEKRTVGNNPVVEAFY